MNDTKGFFHLILMAVGVMVVFTIIANLAAFGVEGPWNEVTMIVAPLILAICFLGFVAYMVVNR